MTDSDASQGPVFDFRHNVVRGDQINQAGQVNIGKVAGGLGDDYDDAVKELRYFIADLKRSGIVAPTGEITDDQRLEDAVLERKPRLKAVARALATGARSVLLGVVNGAATPAILQFIEKLVK
jgi:hypothetical protein